MGNAYLYNMPSGIPGAVNRIGGGGKIDIEAVILDPVTAFPAYGLFGQIDAVTGYFRPLLAADAVVYGPLVRPFPTQPTSTAGYSGASPLGAGLPPTKGTGPVLKSGYMTVKLQGNNAGMITAAVKNGAVYVCVQNPPAAGVVGGITAAADGGNTVLLPAGSYFMGPADADGNIEIAYNI